MDASHSIDEAIRALAGGPPLATIGVLAAAGT